MFLREKTYRQQCLLAQYIRSGDEKILDELDAVNVRGIRYYRELIINIIYDGISNAYPITTDFFGKKKMMQLTHEFFTHVKCQTPQVWAMPREFMDYIQEHRIELYLKYPFLHDLLLFEWIEIEIFMMPDKHLPYVSEKGNILTDRLVLNPEIQILVLHYPVHLLHPKNIKKKHKGEYLLLVYRHPENKQVIFTELNYFAYQIIKSLNQNPTSISELRDNFANSNFKIDDNNIVHFIESALENKIIIGFQREFP